MPIKKEVIIGDCRNEQCTEDEAYIASNGTDFMIFMESWCYQCRVEPICKILNKVMASGGEVKQLRIKEGRPVCTSFANKADRKNILPCKKTIDMFVEQPKKTPKQGNLTAL